MRGKLKRNSGVVNIGVNNGVVNISGIDPTTQVGVLDRRADHFNRGPGALVEQKSPVPPLADMTAYTNRCVASHARGRNWVDVPHVAIEEEDYYDNTALYFNAAAFAEYGLHYKMALMPLATADFSVVAFVLGREFFPNENAYNKYGYAEMSDRRYSKAHKIRTGYDGQPLPNPEWHLGSIRNDGLTRLLEDGSAATGRKWYDRQAPLYLDREKFSFKNRKRRYYVVYFKPAELYAPEPERETDKLVAPYSQILRRNRWTDRVMASTN